MVASTVVHEAMPWMRAMIMRSWIQPAADWLDAPSLGRVLSTMLITAMGLALYGFSVGYGRAPLMGVYVAVKLPLLVFLTLLANGLLNGLLGMLLGIGLGFRQSLLALLSAFALAALVLGSLSPVTFLLAWSAVAPSAAEAQASYQAHVLMHTLLIAFAGIVANAHLHRLLAMKAPTRTAAVGTLLAWVAGNGLLGAQFSWILRPFFGAPTLEVQFLREDPLFGNFYIAVWNTLLERTDGHPLPALLLIFLGIGLVIGRAVFRSLTPISP